MRPERTRASSVESRSAAELLRLWSVVGRSSAQRLAQRGGFQSGTYSGRQLPGDVKGKPAVSISECETSPDGHFSNLQWLVLPLAEFRPKRLPHSPKSLVKAAFVSRPVSGA